MGEADFYPLHHALKAKRWSRLVSPPHTLAQLFLHLQCHPLPICLSGLDQNWQLSLLNPTFGPHGLVGVTTHVLGPYTSDGALLPQARGLLWHLSPETQPGVPRANG